MIIKYGYKGFEQTLEQASKELPEGWRPLFIKLCQALFEMGWNGTLFQTKEKFGGLRFYPERISDEMHDRIHKAAIESFRTCQVCGAPGKNVCSSSGWYMTVCDEHMPELWQGEDV